MIVNLVIFAWLLSPKPLAASILLENFEQYSEGAFPAKWRGKNDDAQKIYRIASENGNRFLRAQSNNQGVQLALERGANPKEQRRLSWRWRVHTFPNGADERLGAKHDAAAQVYVIFDNQFWPRVIKYVWSAALPVGSRFDHPLYNRGHVVVLRSGPAEKNQWFNEEINFSDDYRSFFGAEPGKLQDRRRHQVCCLVNRQALTARFSTAAGWGRR